VSDEPGAHASRDRELDEFATRGAHQVGEALALLRGAALSLEALHDPAVEEALNALRASAERAGRYADDLLDVVAAGRGPDPRGGRGSDLSRALVAATERLGPDLARAGAKVTAGELGAVALEPGPAERLLTHAVRAALAAGARSVEVTAGRDGDVVRVEVGDDAAPPGSADAFDAFGPPRGRGALVGAGVSLTTCARIVRGHGGEIALAPRPGGGTVLRFTLPAGAPAAAAAAVPNGRRLEPPLRVLLCDDVAELRSLLRRRLEGAGDMVVVGEAGDAAAALREAVVQLPEVIVLDLEMPGLEPAELVESLGRVAPRASLVTFSGHEPSAIAGPAAAGIALHVPKTTDLAAVERALRDLASRELRAA
jgi:CheY-like chemotaxis protein